MVERLTVQQVASETGLSAHTLRYYERIGLLDRVSRATSGHRRYSGEDLEWITLLQRLRSTGMPISKMKHFANFVREGKQSIPQRRELLEAHEQKLKTQRKEIDLTLKVLSGKLSHYWVAETGFFQNAKTGGRDGI